jgi:hypothetical protein
MSIRGCNARYSACASVGLPCRASLTGLGDWFGPARRQVGVTVLSCRLDTAGRCWRGFGRARSDRSRSWCHRSRAAPSHPPVRRRDPLRGRRLSSPPSWLPGRRLATRTVPITSPAVINSAPRPRPTPANSGGAKRGASTGRRQATPGDSQRRFPQLDHLSDHTQPRAATSRMRLKSGRSAVRPRP